MSMKIENGCRRKDTFWTGHDVQQKKQYLDRKMVQTLENFNWNHWNATSRSSTIHRPWKSRGEGRCFNTFTSLLGLLALGPFLPSKLGIIWGIYRTEKVLAFAWNQPEGPPPKGPKRHPKRHRPISATLGAAERATSRQAPPAPSTRAACLRRPLIGPKRQ
jgi:hypothetical protein